MSVRPYRSMSSIVFVARFDRLLFRPRSSRVLARTATSSQRFFDSAFEHKYKIHMTGVTSSSVRRRLPYRKGVVADLTRSLLRTRQTASTFEFAYQARIAVERIRFAIRQTDQLAVNQPVLQEVGMQLLDALDRLETAERHFEAHFRQSVCSLERVRSVPNGIRDLGRYKSQTE
jgi:hypothetical protein